MRKNDKNNLRKSPEGAREYQVRSGASSIYTCFHQGFIAQSVERMSWVRISLEPHNVFWALFVTA